MCFRGSTALATCSGYCMRRRGPDARLFNGAAAPRSRCLPRQRRSRATFEKKGVAFSDDRTDEPLGKSRAAIVLTFWKPHGSHELRDNTNCCNPKIADSPSNIEGQMGLGQRDAPHNIEGHMGCWAGKTPPTTWKGTRGAGPARRLPQH
eukprot:341482-Chlamydomonas_euryale.AAC.2